MKVRLAMLEQELKNIKRMIYGSKSERFIPTDSNQLTLDFGDEVKEQVVTKEETITITRRKPKKESIKIAIRQKLPAHLPRREVIIEPEIIPEGAKKIGEIITETLEYEPGRIYVTCYKRIKYVVKEEEKIIVPELPTLPIPKGIASASLLAYILISKFIDHLPFYRLVQIFKRENVILAESTINGWFSEVCELLIPLYNLLVKRLLECDYLMADESPIPVQTKEKQGKTHTGYQWIYYSPHEKIVCFDYRQSRGREGPILFLKDFKGALQTDGYAVYNYFETKENIHLLACMAHARRKFEQALSNDKVLAEHALSVIQMLYTIERQASENNLNYDEIRKLRIEQSVPILDQFEKWMKEKSLMVLPKSAIGNAISYTLNLWKRLKRYTEDGKYQIDNNLVENSIRPMALGRKNYLFAGSHNAAQRAAMMYTFFGTCKINNINPLEWFTHVLSVIPDCKLSKLDELLPQNFSKQ